MSATAPPERDIVTWDDLDRLVAGLADQLADSQFDVMLAITRGGLVPAGMLAYRLRIRNILIAAVEYYDDHGKPGPRPTFLQFPADPLLRGQRILVVDEVWDSGTTIHAVTERDPPGGRHPDDGRPPLQADPFRRARARPTSTRSTTDRMGRLPVQGRRLTRPSAPLFHLDARVLGNEAEERHRLPVRIRVIRGPCRRPAITIGLPGDVPCGGGTMTTRTQLLVGTKKGAFILESDEARRDWSVQGPMCEGWPIHDLITEPGSGAILAAGGNAWYGPAVFRSEDGGKTWTSEEAQRHMVVLGIDPARAVEVARGSAGAPRQLVSRFRENSLGIPRFLGERLRQGLG